MRRYLWGSVCGLISCGLVAVTWLSAQTPPPPERPIEERLDMTRVLLERATQDYDRCKNDLADLWVQARKLSLDYQQVVKERDTLKTAAPKDSPPPGPPTN